MVKSTNNNQNYTLEQRIEKTHLKDFTDRTRNNLDLIVGTALATMLYPNPLGIAAVVLGLYLYNKNKHPEETKRQEKKVYELETRIKYLVQKYQAEIAETLFNYGLAREEVDKYLQQIFNREEQQLAMQQLK